MSAAKPSETLNYLKAPIEWLWADSKVFSLEQRILMAVAHAEGSAVRMDNQSLVNITGASKDQVRDALKALTRKGLVNRKDGEVSLIVETLPDPDEKGLRALRAFSARAKIPGNPVPLKARLEGRRRKAAEALTYRFPATTLQWLVGKDAFAVDNLQFWATQVRKRIMGSETLKDCGSWALGQANLDEGTLTAPDALIGWLTEAARLIDQTETVRHVPKTLQYLLKELEEKGSDLPRHDRIRAGLVPWLHLLDLEPLEDRQTVSDYLASEPSVEDLVTETLTADTPVSAPSAAPKVQVEARPLPEPPEAEKGQETGLLDDEEDEDGLPLSAWADAGLSLLDD